MFASTPVFAQQATYSLDMQPPTVRIGQQITITVRGQPGHYYCLSPNGSCTDVSKFVPFPSTGVVSFPITTDASNTTVGPFTMHAQFYLTQELDQEISGSRQSKTITVQPAGSTPPGPIDNIHTIESTLTCESQGLVKDAATGLCLPPNPYGKGQKGIVGSTTVGQFIQRILDILLTLAGIVAVVFIIIGAYMYITSRGAEDQAKSGRKTMLYAIIGLIAVLLAYTLVSLITNLVTTGTVFGQ